jgi:hypothetical protein
MRVFSYGGGVQSTAVLVLAARGEIQYDAFLFANVGDDSEHPEALAYIREIAWPYAERHGIPLEELTKRRRDGSQGTLLDRIRRTKRSIPIPARLSGGKPASRACTLEYKVRVVSRWLIQHGGRNDGATVGLGISTDEMGRARSISDEPDWKRLEYPLLDRRLSREDCRQIVREAGLPEPHKSACWFCPFTVNAEWRRMAADDPERFAAACTIEADLSQRGHGPVYLSKTMRPLSELVDGQLTLDDALSACESGYCEFVF